MTQPTLNDFLSAGFAQTHRRLRCVFLDLLWKVVWMAFTGAAVLGVFAWVTSILRSVPIQRRVPSLAEPLLGAALARQLWEAYATKFFWILALLLFFAIALWTLLEAYFRAGLLPPSRESFMRSAANHFRIFLASSIAKALSLSATVLSLSVIILGRYGATPLMEWGDLWKETRGPLIVAVTIAASIWFALSVFETAIRCNALELLGTNFFQVVGLIGTLVAFEALIIGAFAIGVTTLLLTISGSTELLLALGVSTISFVFLTVLHSYLLVVRFRAVGIMKHVADV
jgi:hypothetical protein